MNPGVPEPIPSREGPTAVAMTVPLLNGAMNSVVSVALPWGGAR